MRIWLPVVWELLLAAGLAFAQGNAGSILGTVTDSSGAVVPAAKVSVIDVDTGVVTPVQSDGLGNYWAQFLPPGSYRVEAEIGGFKKFRREQFRLDMNKELRIDIQLEPGVLSETIRVSAQASLVDTETGEQSNVLENILVNSLPLLGRDPQALRNLVPGISSTGIAEGGLVRKDPYYIDGGNVALHVYGGLAVDPNPDALQEIRVVTNNFSAEFGQASGFIMEATTKSGTNAFHGSLFEFFRNDKLNAGNFFTHTRSVLRFNQFGGTVSGPIRKNKTFFFLDGQWKRQRGMSQWNNLTVPSDAAKSGDFSSFQNQIFDPLSGRTVQNASGNNVVVRDPFVGNRIPASRLSPAALKIQALYPSARINAPYANYSYSASSSSPENAYDLKIDHNFSDRDRLMARYSFRQIDNLQPAPFPNPEAGGADTYGPEYYERGQQAMLDEVHIFGSRTTNDFHATVFRRNVERGPAGYGQVGPEDFGVDGMPSSMQKLGTPIVIFSGLIGPAQLASDPSTLIAERQHSFAVVNTTSVIRGRHNIKFGGEITRLRIDNFQPNPYTTDFTFKNTFTDQVGFANTGIDYASFLLGLPTSLTYNIYPSFIQPRTSIYALFVEDDIRVSRKLTINAGLRWDAPLHFHEKRNRSGVFDLDKGQYVQFGTNGFRTTDWDQDWINFGPRLGFAYTPLGGSRTVIRGAYGMFTVGDQGSGQAGGMPLSPIFGDGDVGRYTTTDQITWKTTLDNVPYQVADKTGSNATSVVVYPANNPTSYFQQFNLNVQQQVKGFMVEVGYAGSRGVHLPYGSYNWNAIPTNLAAQAQGQFISPYVRNAKYPGGITMNSWIGSSIYHSLQAKVERRLSGGLALMAAYTWAKLIATGDVGYRDPLNNRNLDRGVTGDSPPHRLTVTYVYQLPVGKGRRWLRAGPATYVLGGWEVSGIDTFQSGIPLTPGTTFNSCVCGAINRPNVVGNPGLSGSQRTLNAWFNTSAFTQPALYTVGNSGRSLFLGPGLFNMDGALRKRFMLPGPAEVRSIEFRGEFFSMTNTPQFGNPNTTIGSGTVGRITSVNGGSRQIQMALKFYW
jgi:Carboxypeptidase regulatory-like domain/TonB dependent receptor